MQEQAIDLTEQLQFREALEVLRIDAVFSAEHLERRYQISLERAEEYGLHILRRELDVSLDGDRQTVTFVTPDPRISRCTTTSLCLLAGMAELRYQLGLPTDCWDNWWSTFYFEAISPKANLYIGHEDIVIDYDTGKHVEYLVETAQVYRDEGYLRQIWGAPSRERRDGLEVAIQAVNPTAQVIYAPYIPEPKEVEEEEFKKREATRKDRWLKIELPPSFP
jgi:hypothetical protein